MINFNEATFFGDELDNIQDAIQNRHISGNGPFTKKCNVIIEDLLQSQKVLLTTSGSAALEMASLILGIEPGDEVICPSYTFVTTASSFAGRGAKIVFVDIRDDTLNIDESKIEEAITSKTKAIIPVHYAGVCADMDSIVSIANQYGIRVVEDAAQALGSLYKGKQAGALGDLGCFSFHETKNISCGEGGAISINREDLKDIAEIVWEKGTDRSKFLRGQVDKYSWVRLGSSYLPSEIIAAYLYSHLTRTDLIGERRKQLWQNYFNQFRSLPSKGIRLPYCPDDCEHNAHMFYLRFPSLELRSRYIAYMRQEDIICVFHYIPLHSSEAGKKYGIHAGDLPVTDTVSDTLVRLPLFYHMTDEQQQQIIERTLEFAQRM